MKLKIAVHGIGVCIAILLITNTTVGQQAERTMNQKVGFRLGEWQTIHGNETKKTQETVATLKQLGCEVREADHGNHVDIRFRCPNWKSVAVDNDDQAAKWQKWLMSKKFETITVAPSSEAKMPKVKIRLPEWKTFHFENREQVSSIEDAFELIGCQVEIANHGNHVDAKVRCPEWTTIGLPDDKTAHNWQDWLNQAGFETKHEHVAVADRNSGNKNP